MTPINYLRRALLFGAQEGNEVRMLIELNKYYESRQAMKSPALEERLYYILSEAIEHNIRRDVSIGLGTDEHPRYNVFDLVKIISNLSRLLEIKSGIKYEINVK